MSVSLADFRAYATARGFTAPAQASDTAAESALLRGTDYISLEYVSRFRPNCTVDEANMDAAIYEAAMMELDADGLLLPGPFWSSVYTAGERKVLTEVKGIKWQVLEEGYSVGGPLIGPRSPKIDGLLRACAWERPSGVLIKAVG